jgi:hypothetical protein
VGPGGRGDPVDRSDLKGGDRREPVRAAGGSSEGEPKRRSKIPWQQCRFIGDAVRKTSKVRRRQAQAESVVRPGRMRERPDDPLRNATWNEHRESNLRQRPKTFFR